jgi:hypothetical protein
MGRGTQNAMSARPTDTRAAAAPVQPGGAHRVVILANDVIGDEALVREIKRHVDGRQAEALVVAPAIVESPLDLAAGAVDADIEQARKRLDTSIAALERIGIKARGTVGEADPNLALEDALRLFPADEVIMVVHPRERRSWLEEDVVDQARIAVTVPITVIEVMPGAGVPPVADVKEVASAADAAAAGRDQAAFEADYLPPMRPRDRAALIVGPLGCLALAFLALDCQGDFHLDFGNSDVGCIVSYVFGVYALIVTAIHVPAILVLQGERQARGLKDFMSLSILYAIPAMVVAAAIAVVVW